MLAVLPHITELTMWIQLAQPGIKKTSEDDDGANREERKHCELSVSKLFLFNGMAQTAL